MNNIHYILPQNHSLQINYLSIKKAHKSIPYAPFQAMTNSFAGVYSAI